ncbi:hypothetical protein [Shinella zoogloeoides]|jgi:hypothetical protein|uniref:hypothetical protein n=1 Tax=Shinella zoogloeoides TaxID=352475 RepID=UPI001F567E75|nr:hypothetical protein [Shinella zoogloeoides]
MTKTLNTTFAAALVAASVFGASAAFASGDYYVGGSPDAVSSQSQNVDRFQTNSIGDKHVAIKRHAPIAQPYDHGDYRPAGSDMSR